MSVVSRTKDNLKKSNSQNCKTIEKYFVVPTQRDLWKENERKSLPEKCWEINFLILFSDNWLDEILKQNENCFWTISHEIFLAFILMFGIESNLPQLVIRTHRLSSITSLNWSIGSQWIVSSNSSLDRLLINCRWKSQFTRSWANCCGNETFDELFFVYDFCWILI